jgi:hypothetical protein
VNHAGQLASTNEASASAAAARTPQRTPRSRRKLPVRDRISALAGKTIRNSPTESSSPALRPEKCQPAKASAAQATQ